MINSTQSGVPWSKLTPREHELLVLLCMGWSNRQIAEAESIGLETVKSHVVSILRKVGVKQRARLIAAALHHGVVDLRPYELVESASFE